MATIDEILYDQGKQIEEENVVKKSDFFIEESEDNVKLNKTNTKIKNKNKRLGFNEAFCIYISVLQDFLKSYESGMIRIIDGDERLSFIDKFNTKYEAKIKDINKHKTSNTHPFKADNNQINSELANTYDFMTIPEDEYRLGLNTDYNYFKKLYNLTLKVQIIKNLKQNKGIQVDGFDYVSYVEEFRKAFENKKLETNNYFEKRRSNI